MSASIDFFPFLSQIDFGTVVTFVLAFAGSFAVFLVAFNGSGKLLDMLRDQQMVAQAREREVEFSKRYARERRNREYQEWKRSKGF